MLRTGAAPRSPGSDMVRAWTAAFGIGLAVGIATSLLQGVLGGDANTLANSGAIWSVLAFLVAAAVGATRGGAIGAGLFGLLGDVTGYYAIASPVRDIATSTTERLLWTAAALVLGPLLGLAADLWRRGAPTQRLYAGLSICGVVAGEGVHLVTRVSATHLAGWIEIAAALGVGGLLVRRSALPRHEQWVAVVGALVVSMIVVLGYGGG